MGYLTDTNIVSELMKPSPDPGVKAWVQQNLSEIYLSSITIGEIRYGISLLEEGKRKQLLQAWLKTLARATEGRTLSFNRSVAYVWADMRAGLSQEGIRLPLADGMIAATARRYGHVIATRNIGDFANVGVPVINPFDPDQTGLTQ